MTASVTPVEESPASISIVLDVRSALAWTNARITVVKRQIRHRHDDTEWWATQGTEARWAQRERETLRQVANLLHVERATSRGRLHGFATLEEQRAWLAKMEKLTCYRAAAYLHVPKDSTLVALRAGQVTQEREADRAEGIDARADKVL